MPTDPITVEITSDLAPTLAAIAFAKLEVWRFGDIENRSIDVITIPGWHGNTVRLYPNSESGLPCYRGSADTLHEAVTLALSRATDAGAA